MEQSATIEALADALAQAQAEFAPIVRDKTAKIKTRTGGEYSYSFADLATTIAAVRPILAKYGLSVAQSPGEFQSGPDGKMWVVVFTQLMHKSGQWLRGQTWLPVAELEPRGLGSAFTYARRYGFGAMLGLATEDDDDGGGHGGPVHGQRAAEPRATQRPQAPSRGQGAGRPSNGRAAVADDEIPF